MESPALCSLLVFTCAELINKCLVLDIAGKTILSDDWICRPYTCPRQSREGSWVIVRCHLNYHVQLQTGFENRLVSAT
ncbi:hypothetical protein EDD85DRAFT_166404 [Armillaria nabsnona]|nr:hypothetical protein EDD85DRAFT_166404 [Armillaria nabsnona]